MIDIFYDGLQIEKWEGSVRGFTTNTTLFSTSAERNYTTFYHRIQPLLKGRPFSLQIWQDDGREQIDAIHRIDPTIFVKIPIVNSRGQYNDELISHAVKRGIPINVTCLYTAEQITHVRALLEGSSAPEIISVFGGPISDTGMSPDAIVQHAVQLFSGRSQSRILWAGCREVYTIHRAEALGCHIITVPDVILEKLSTTKSLDEMSLDRARIFRTHALDAMLTIE